MPKKAILTLTAMALIAVAIWPAPALAQDKAIIVQSTTSTQNSGLFKHLLPIFEKKTGIKVHVVAVGTGQAIKNSQNGDGDVLLVHAKSTEEQFVKEGWGVERFDLMYNDYIVVGPPADPAKVGGMKDAKEAFKKIATAQAPFVSRGDNSGTHKAELQIWKAAGVDPKKASGKWYREAGSGMGATLNTGVGMGAYVLADRGTWIGFKNKRDYRIQVEGAK
ncbi:MAG: substrate-binding domain-containing protein, partial [Rhodospirillales bacterium]|nr:substrate-binding domain-containing protein [Rhodospirillales bacterium]